VVVGEPDLGAGPEFRDRSQNCCPAELLLACRTTYKLDIRYLLFCFIHHRFYFQYKRRILRSNTGNTGYLAFNGAFITNGESVVESLYVQALFGMASKL
jgi:hypothetical protein